MIRRPPESPPFPYTPPFRSPVAPAQTRRFADVLALLGFDRRGDVKAAGRAGFVRGGDERAVYDVAFDLFLRPSTARRAPSRAPPPPRPKGNPPTRVRLRPPPAPQMDVT